MTGGGDRGPLAFRLGGRGPLRFVLGCHWLWGRQSCDR
ncbi:unnamed protein product [[Actinomadura] parvosata subsp. kistnae]|nr:unnamed protein product [Actinomadura parvosata subsp. kistnae]